MSPKCSKPAQPTIVPRAIPAIVSAGRRALAPGALQSLTLPARRGGRILIHGLPITEFCDEQTLSTHERLRLFTDVCRAVQHAHQKGIIHRDLKPSNILVTLQESKPVPKVIDFGVAKALSQQLTDKTIYTAYGQMVGTPLYMSPEQAEMTSDDVDTRSDVYSLGVLLYELLTGSTPFDKQTLKQAGFDEMRRIIREDEPPKPSARISTLKAEALSTVSGKRGTVPNKLGSSYRGELDWIVMKALEKDRSRRYESASAFALDIQRHLSGETVQACPPSLSYRTRKLLSRHRLSLTVATLVATSLSVGLAVAVWQADVAQTQAERAEQAREQEQIERQRAETNLAEARKQSQRAEENLESALDAVETLLTEVSGEELKHAPQAEQIRKRLLEKALALHERLLQQHPDDGSTVAATGRSNLRMAAILVLLGEQQRARKSHQRALEIFTQLRSDDKPETLEWLANAHDSFGVLLSKMSRETEAEVHLRKGLAIRQKPFELLPGHLSHQGELAHSHGNLSTLLKTQKQFAAAERLCGEAIRLQQDVLAKSPKSRAAGLHLTKLYQSQSSLLLRSRRIDEARRALERAKTLLVELHRDHPDDRGIRLALVDSSRDHAHMLRRFGKLSVAVDEFQQATEMSRRLVKDFPAAPIYQIRLIESLEDTAILQGMLRRDQDSRRTFVEAHTAAEKLSETWSDVPDFQRMLVHVCNNFGFYLIRLGEPQKANAILEQGLKSQKQLVARFPKVVRYQETLVAALTNIGISFNRQKQPAKALAAYVQGSEVARKLIERFPNAPEYKSNLAGLLHNISMRESAAGRVDDAKTLLEEAVGLQEAAVKARPKTQRFQSLLANHFQSLGLAFSTLKQSKEAEAAYYNKTKIFEGLVQLAPGVPAYELQLARAYDDLYVIRNVQLKQTQRAADACRKAIDLYHSLVKRHSNDGTFRAGYSRALRRYGGVSKTLGIKQDAIQRFLQAVAFYEKLVTQPPKEAMHHSNLTDEIRTLCVEADKLLGFPVEAVKPQSISR